MKQNPRFSSTTKNKRLVSKDQKHRSIVAKRVCLRRKIREVTDESQQAQKKLKGIESIDKHDHLVSSQLLVLRAPDESAAQIYHSYIPSEEAKGSAASFHPRLKGTHWRPRNK